MANISITEKSEPTIAGSWEEFKRIVSDFLKAAPTADKDALDAGAKCVGLAYLGIQWDDENHMHTIHRNAGAPALMRIVMRAVVEREIAIDKETERAEGKCCCGATVGICNCRVHAATRGAL